MKKSIFTSIIAILAVMTFAVSAYAVPQRVGLKTTVPNIPKSVCYQAGTISMEFDAGTAMAAGDVIQFTLNNGVVLCKDIEFFLPAVSATQGFLVKGSASSLIVTMTLGTIGADGVFETTTPVIFLVPVAQVDPYTISLFDEKIVSGLLPLGVATEPILKDDSAVAGKAYLVPIIAADNVICIDTLTFDYQGERVEVTPDSIVALAANKLTFTGEREIARILAASEYALVTCKDSPVVGNIILGEGQGASCPPFDFDDNGINYCPGTHENNKIIIQALTNPFPVNDYKISLEVKVNGLTGDQGVYIYQNYLEYLSTTTLDDVCNATGLTALEFEDYVAPGACTQSTDVLPGGEGCTVDCANKVVKATTFTSNLGITQGGGQSYLRLALPSFRYDTGIVKEGDVVSVRLIVEQYPCGTILDEEIQIGTFGCAPATRATTLLFPYFTPANGSYFWSAYAITNISGADGNVTLYMYESDGDAFTGVLATPVKAHTIWTTLLSDSIVNPDITWTQTAGTGTPGDAQCYIQASTTFTADGFGFIAGSPTGESMGYLPRVNGHE